MDERILALIESGKGKIRAEIEAKVQDELKRHTEWMEAWDIFDDDIRRGLPTELRPYMVTNRDPEREYDLPTNKSSYEYIRIEIPGLAWFTVKMNLNEDGWTLGTEFMVPVAVRDRFGYDDEDQVIYKSTMGWSLGIKELDLALARAAEQGEIYRQRTAELELAKAQRDKRLTEPVYVPVEEGMSIGEAIKVAEK